MDAKAAFAIKTLNYYYSTLATRWSLDESSLQIFLLMCPQNKYEN